ncbi:hypothetical protein [Pseudoduganella chitinolytica]|uniref:Uncharacterized protein n=1 Tax=Pseudoduganella chitinolytica TaxID=34070 RepID=A0ABY8BAR0_9BURK|nr:hypothetical protein [Pseudoduganella chitinolytica]WEF32223.1 hypothetical protein PX653_22825 [Pseudoduganella chitinolytica]
MPLPIAGAMTAAASLGRMAGAAVQTAVTAARASPLAPMFQQLATKLRSFDPATLATLLQVATAQPAATAPAAPPPLPPRPAGGALAARLRDTAPRKPAAPPAPAASNALPAAAPSPHHPGELARLLASAWDQLETALGGMAATLPGGRSIGAEMLELIGPRLRALNEELAPLLQGAAPPAAEESKAAATLRHQLEEMGENNALDLVGGQAAPGGGAEDHGKVGKHAPGHGDVAEPAKERHGTSVGAQP